MDDTGRPPTEPSHDIRTACSVMWQMYVGLSHEGFSERQALEIIGYMLRGAQEDM